MERRQAIKMFGMLFGTAAAPVSVGALLSGCGPSGESASSGEMATAMDDKAAQIAQAKQVLTTLFDDVLTQNKLELIDELYSPEYEFIVPKLAGMTSNIVKGRENFKNRVIAFRTAFPDVVYKIQSFVSDGEIVASSFAFTGTQAGDFAGFAATNRKVTITGNHFAQLKGGKIIKTWAGFTNIQEALAPAPAQG